MTSSNFQKFRGEQNKLQKEIVVGFYLWEVWTHFSFEEGIGAAVKWWEGNRFVTSLLSISGLTTHHSVTITSWLGSWSSHSTHSLLWCSWSWTFMDGLRVHRHTWVATLGVI